MGAVFALGRTPAATLGFVDPLPAAPVRVSAFPGIMLGVTDQYGVHWSTQRGSDAFGNAPSPRDISGERAVADGSWNATEFFGPRSWPISLIVTGPHAELHRARVRLTQACGLLPFPVAVDEPGIGPRVAWFRRSGELMWTEESTTVARATFTLIGDDPLLRGLPRVVTAKFPTVSGGRTWPTTWPGSWAATVTAGVMTLQNAGTVPASIRWRIDGPVTNPLLIDEATNRALRTDLVLGAGEWLTIDTATHRVLANGDPAASRRDRLYGDWFHLLPGPSVVRLGGTGTSAASLVTATWADTYI